MLTQLDCPLEARAAFITLDSSGRARAELSLANLANETVVSFRGAARYVNDRGELLLEQSLDLDGLNMPRREVMALPIAADGADGAVGVSLIISHIYYEGRRMPWKPQGSPVDIPAPRLPDDESLRQLRAVAGPDAVCYPRLHMNYWLCVCGRANCDDAAACLRCGRVRGMVMRTLTRDIVRAEFPARQRAARQAREEERRAAKQRDHREELKYQAEIRKNINKDRTMLIRRTATLLGLALILLVVGWLLSRRASDDLSPATPPPPVDRGALAKINVPRIRC